MRCSTPPRRLVGERSPRRGRGHRPLDPRRRGGGRRWHRPGAPPPRAGADQRPRHRRDAPRRRRLPVRRRDSPRPRPRPAHAHRRPQRCRRPSRRHPGVGPGRCWWPSRRRVGAGPGRGSRRTRRGGRGRHVNPQVDFLLTGAGQLVTADPGLGSGPLGLVERGAVAAARGTVVFAGPEAALPDLPVAPDCDRIDAGGRSVVPGFVDAHTHLIFAGDRADEFAARLRGVGYEQALAAGGGIHRTVRETRAASDAELEGATAERLLRAGVYGTTTLEVKSGYGLTVDDERRSLEVLARLSARTPVDVVPTFLGAHRSEERRVGKEGRKRRRTYN